MKDKDGQVAKQRVSGVVETVCSGESASSSVTRTMVAVMAACHGVAVQWPMPWGSGLLSSCKPRSNT